MNPNLHNVLLTIGAATLLGTGVSACTKESATGQPQASNSRTSEPGYSQTRSDEGTTGTVVANAEQAASDTWITTKVKSELLADSIARGLDVNVDTKLGVVTLQGSLEDETVVDHVADIAAGVEGVTRVDSSALFVDAGR